MEKSLASLAEYLKARVIGDGSVLIRGIGSYDTAQEGYLTFAENPRSLTHALESKASGIMVGWAATDADLKGRSGISVENPRLAFALLLQLFNPDPAATGTIHPSAILGKDVQIDKLVDIGAHAFIGDRVRIGKGTIIDPGTYIGNDVSIGENCRIGPNVAVYHHCVIGSRVRLFAGVIIGGDGFGYVFDRDHYVRVPQIGNVIIEDDVEIGCNSCVDRATIGSTVVGRGSKFDNQVQVAHNDQIGKHVILAGQVGLAGSVTIGDYCLLGGKSGVIDHLTLGKKARLGAASIVTKDVPEGEVQWGYPAERLNDAKEQMVLIRRLPELHKRIKELEARLAALERSPK